MDTLQFARKVFPDLKNYKLTTLFKKFTLSKNEHRALEDCISTKQLYDLIKKQWRKKLKNRDHVLYWKNKGYCFQQYSV